MTTSRADEQVGTTTLTQQQKVAQAYADVGIIVIPLWPGKKKPRGTGWERTKAVDLAPWFDPQHPHYDPRNNVGCHVGATGLIVLDLDLKHEQARNWLAAKKLLHGDDFITGTICHETANAGLHAFYLPTACGLTKTIINLDDSNIDVLIGNRQAVMPGSTLLFDNDDKPLDTPRHYRRAPGSRSLTEPGYLPAPIPDWLLADIEAWDARKEAKPATPPQHSLPRPATPPVLARLQAASEERRAAAYGASAIDGAVEDVASAMTGSRHNTLRDKAIHLGGLARDCNLDEQEITRRLADAGRRLGLQEREISDTVRDGLRYGLAHGGRGLPTSNRGAWLLERASRAKAVKS